MEDAFAVDVLDCLQELVHVCFDFVLLEILVANQALVEILIHQLEDKSQFAWVNYRVPVGSS